MPTTDALGRRRQPAQQRGLRSLFPTLPTDCRSRLLRIAMSAAAWTALDGLVKQSSAPTAPRAVGQLLEEWLAGAPRTEPAHATAAAIVADTAALPDWQAWQMQKELALLAAAGGPELGRTVH